jgi:hypothetical protein
VRLATDLDHTRGSVFTAGPEPDRMSLSTGSPTRARLRSAGVAVGVALLALGVGFALVGGTLLGLRAAGFELTPLVLLVVSLLLFQGVTMGGVALLYVRYRGLTGAYVGLDDVLGNPVRDLAAVAGGFVCAVAAVFVGGLVITALGLRGGTNQAAEIAARDPDVLLLLIPGAFLLIGPGEELLFRGVIQNRLRESFPPAVAVVLAAALFAAVHVTAIVGDPAARLVSIAVLFLPSLVFGAAYEYTGNLAVPSLIHGAYNALLFSILYVTLRFAGELPEQPAVAVVGALGV